MRKPFVAGNWKMNKTAAEAASLVGAMLPELDKIDAVETVLCPPATAIPAVSGLVKSSKVGVGTQNLHWEESGAFTGEESITVSTMLTSSHSGSPKLSGLSGSNGFALSFGSSEQPSITTTMTSRDIEVNRVTLLLVVASNHFIGINSATI